MLLHTRLLWPIHRYHHSAEEFCTLTSIRSHPLEAAMDALPSAFAFALLGVPTGIAATLFTFKRFITAFHHSQFQGDWGWAGRWLLIAPRMHLIHHSIDPKHYGSNYGSMLPIWDRLFGTCVDDSHSAIRLGLIDGERESGSYVRGSALGYLKFWAGLRDQMRGKAATAY